MNYVLDRIYQQVEKLATDEFGKPISEVRRPPKGSQAIYAVPCFQHAKERKTNPMQLAEQVATRWSEGLTDEGLIERFEAARGYVNVFANQQKLLAGILQDAETAGECYGTHADRGQTVVVDYCSPNIAKPLSVGHLRSTIIGQALINILRVRGYKVVGINFLSDWGTQFGKLLYAFDHWGDEGKFATDPIGHLLDLYVHFHKEAKENPTLEDKGRTTFRKLEQGDAKERALWKRFREESLNSFEKTVGRLGVHFDHNWFESEFEKKAHDLIDSLLEQGIAEHSEGAVIIRTFEDEDKPPLVARKSDGTTLYASRDLASALERIERFKPVSKLIYAVATEQNLHFANLAKALERIGFPGILEHVRFGMVSLPSGKISTREGRVVYLDELLDEAERRAAEIITEKNPDMAADTRAEVARRVGIGSVIYADLSQDRIKDIVFDWKRMLAFDGNSAPYLQYAAVRCARILQKAGLPTGEWVQGMDSAKLEEPESIELVMALGRFPQAIAEAAERYAPHVLAGYLYDTATSLSRFYTQVPVLKAEGEATRLTRLGLVQATESVLRRGLALLGIQTPSEM